MSLLERAPRWESEDSTDPRHPAPEFPPRQRRRRLWLAVVAAVIVLSAVWVALRPGPPSPAPTTTFYVDITNGTDRASGEAPGSAWRSLARATAGLEPGDRLLLRRGGRWLEPLRVSRSGTEDRPIVIGAYGRGARPEVRGPESCVDLGGSFFTVRDLELGPCVWAGVRISGSSNRVAGNVIMGNAAGIVVRRGAIANSLVGNQLMRNNRMSVLTKRPSNDDSGAFGILLQGDRTEVAHNTISGSDAFSFDYRRDGSAIEVFGARRSRIHRNVALENNTFSELGDRRSADNVYSFNLVRSSLPGGHGLTTRGAESRYGPVRGTRLEHTTIQLTGEQSEGFVCHGGCNQGLLRMRNNIVQAVQKVGFADGSFDEDHNLYWGGERRFQAGPHSRVAEPRFVDALAGDLRLGLGSPAVDMGAPLGPRADLDGRRPPLDGDGDGAARPDAGAFERRSTR